MAGDKGGGEEEDRERQRGRSKRLWTWSCGVVVRFKEWGTNLKLLLRLFKCPTIGSGLGGIKI